MSYIGDMTSVLLEEIDFAEKLFEFSNDIAYGYWFEAKARSMVEQINADYKYYIEVTEIKKRMISDKTAQTVYEILEKRIANINAQARGQ